MTQITLKHIIQECIKKDNSEVARGEQQEEGRGGCSAVTGCARE